MSDLIFHLGLTKTASSFLQRKVFGGKIYTMDRSKKSGIKWNEQKTFQSFFTNNPPFVWRKECAKKHLNFSSKRSSVLVSHESLYEGTTSVFPREGGNEMCEPYLLADRLREINSHCWKSGDVKAFFFFRKQYEWMASYYSQVCYRFESPSQKDFEKRVKKLIKNPHKNGAQGIRYNLLLEELENAIGKQNVLAIPYELIQNEETWKKIRTFTGMSGIGKKVNIKKRTVNVKKSEDSESWEVPDRGHKYTLGKIQSYLKKHLSFYDKLNNIRRLGRKLISLEKRYSKSIKIKVSKKIKREVKKMYRKSNKKMEKITEYDLEDKNYY